MKNFTSALLMLSLGACTGQISGGTGPGPRRAGPPPPHRNEPPPPRHNEPPPVVVQPPQPPPPPPAPPEERWVELAAPQRNDDNRDFIAVGAAQGRFRKIRIDVTRGSLVLRQIVVEFGNGENQKLRVDRTILAGTPVVLDLDGRTRKVERVLVYMDPAQRRRDRGVYRLSGL